MSFLTDLQTCCRAYAEFSHDGSLLQLPYRLGGKRTPDEIRAAISAWAGTSVKTTAEIRDYVRKHPRETGIDCSGLVYYALNEASSGAVRAFFEKRLNKPGILNYRYGISAANLTNAAWGIKITAANDIRPGCVMRFARGTHVLVIHSVNRDSAGNVTRIEYTHSNGSKGPHHAGITIGDPTKDLNHASQKWQDIAYTDAKAKRLYNYTLLLTPVANLE